MAKKNDKEYKLIYRSPRQVDQYCAPLLCTSPTIML